MLKALGALCSEATRCNTLSRLFLDEFSTWEERPGPPMYDYWGPGNRAYSKIADGLDTLRQIREARETCYSPELADAWEYVEQGTLSDPLQQYRVGDSVFSMAHEAALTQGHDLLEMAGSAGIVPSDSADLEENFETVERAVKFFSGVKFHDLNAMIRREYLKAIALRGADQKSETGAVAVSVKNPPVRADNVKVSDVSYPENPDIRDLCLELAKEKAKPASVRRSNREVARDLLGCDDRKTTSVLRQAARFPHLWKQTDSADN